MGYLARLAPSATLVAALSLALAPAASAERVKPPKRGPCVPGKEKPLCYVWTGKVKPVDDGDTVTRRAGRLPRVGRAEVPRGVSFPLG